MLSLSICIYVYLILGYRYFLNKFRSLAYKCFVYTIIDANLDLDNFGKKKKKSKKKVTINLDDLENALPDTMENGDNQGDAMEVRFLFNFFVNYYWVR